MGSEYYYTRDGEQFGPVSPLELKALAERGQLQPSDLIWKEGMPEWVPADRVRSLFAARQPSIAKPEIPVVITTPIPDVTPAAVSSQGNVFEFDVNRGQAAARELGQQAAVAGRHAGTVAKAATSDAFQAFKTLMTNPVGGFRIAYDSLGPERAMQVGFIFCIVFDLCVLIGLTFLLNSVTPKGSHSSFANARGIGTSIKILILGLVPLVTATLGCTCVRLIFRGEGSIKSDTFVAGASLLPFGLAVLIAGVVGVANAEVIVAVAVFATTTTILMMYAGCTTIQGIPGTAATLAVPLMILADVWIGKVIFLSLLKT